MMNEDKAGRFMARDVRFTVKDGALCAILMRWPDGPINIGALGRRALGGGPVGMAQSDAALRLTLPVPAPGAVVPVIRIEGRGLGAGAA